jgi:hypothetical protein
MSATVVGIRGGKCRRRKNRQEDTKTIRLRRMLQTCEAQAFEESDATALALSWSIQDKLPCRQLRCIAGTLNARIDFRLRVVEVDLARAEREAYEAKWQRAYLLSGENAVAASAAFPDRERHFQRLREATMDLARTQAHTLADLKRKRRAIGSVWLSADGPWYDELRAGIAADEARLS